MTVALELVADYLAVDPDGAARRASDLPTEGLAGLLDQLGTTAATALLQRLPVSRASGCLASLAPERAATLTAALPVGTAAALVRRLEPSTAAGVLGGVSPERRAPIEELLRHSEHTVGAVMDPLVQIVRLAATANEALAELRAHPAHLYYYVYVVSPAHELVGVLDIPELMLAPPGARLRDIMHGNVVRLLADTPVASAVTHPAWIDYDALPVVDADDRFLGVLRHRHVRQILREDEQVRAPDPSLSTLFALGEIYWLGLCGVLQGLASTATAPASSLPEGTAAS